MKIPVIRGKIGNWRYYSGVMSFKDIQENVTASINEIYKTSCLDELLQRELTRNYESIKKYILKDNERFFNAIILAIYDGDPQWLEVEFRNEERDFTNVGFLQFNGEETIFPVDGQHRVAGIIEALKENPDLHNEQVPVIFIAHSNTDEGKKKTRKLFSTLNRRAKRVGENENIALDEDDACSIITRELVQNFPLFNNDNVANDLGKQIPVSNETAITSLIALYQSVEIIVKNYLAFENIKGEKYKEFKLYRPSDKRLLELHDCVFEVFNSFVANFDCVKEYVESKDFSKAAKYRNTNGGNLLFRPIAFTEVFTAALIIKQRNNSTFDEIFSKMNKVEFEISKSPWKGLIWDGYRIISGVTKSTIRLLLIHMVAPETLTKAERNKLINGYASALNIAIEDSENFLHNL